MLDLSNDTLVHLGGAADGNPASSVGRNTVAWYKRKVPVCHFHVREVHGGPGTLPAPLLVSPSNNTHAVRWGDLLWESKPDLLQEWSSRICTSEYVNYALHPWLDASKLAKINKKINKKINVLWEGGGISIVKIKKKKHWKFVMVYEQLLFSVLVSHLALAFKFLKGWRTVRYFKLHFSDAWSTTCFRKPGLQYLSFSFKACQTCSKCTQNHAWLNYFADSFPVLNQDSYPHQAAVLLLLE